MSRIRLPSVMPDLQAIRSGGTAVVATGAAFARGLAASVVATLSSALFAGLFTPFKSATCYGIAIAAGLVNMFLSGTVTAAFYLSALSVCVRAAALWGIVLGAYGLVYKLILTLGPHPDFAAIAAMGAALPAWFVAKMRIYPSTPGLAVPGDGTLRGSVLIPYQDPKKPDALKTAEQVRASAPDDPTITWGGLELPSRIATTHMLVVGTTGSGKTVSLNRLLKSVVPRIGTGRGWRLCIFDPKTEVISLLRSMGLSCPYYVLNPFDRRCHAWHMAKDLKSPEHIKAVAEILFPVPEHTHNPFWDEAARALGRGVMVAFHKTLREDWTFRDVLLALSSGEHLRQVLSWSPQNASLVEQYLGGNRRTLSDIMATVANHVGRYQGVASYWHHASKANRTISLVEWESSESILILGNSHEAPQTMQHLNRVIFQRLSQILLSRPPEQVPPGRRTWLLLDELGDAGKLDGLHSILKEGRSRGVCAVLGFQDGASIDKTYGKDMAKEIVGQTNSKAILRLQEPGAADWAQAVFGNVEERTYRASETASSGPQGGSSSYGVTEHKDTKPLVMASQFLGIPHSGTPGVKGLGGYYNTASVGAYQWEMPFALIEREMPRATGQEANFEPAAPELGWLEPWTDEELRRLGLSTPREQTVMAPLPPPPTTRNLLDGLDIE